MGQEINGATIKEESNLDELNYLQQVRHILEHGTRRTDRTGTGTLSIFGMQTRYNLREGNLISKRTIYKSFFTDITGIIPLLTTKKVNWKAIVEEVKNETKIKIYCFPASLVHSR